MDDVYFTWQTYKLLVWYDDRSSLLLCGNIKTIFLDSLDWAKDEKLKETQQSSNQSKITILFTT